jgi:hypothetical protein
VTPEEFHRNHTTARVLRVLQAQQLALVLVQLAPVFSLRYFSVQLLFRVHFF